MCATLTARVGKHESRDASYFCSYHLYRIIDVLSQETKKGWHERRAQGLYCGALPFGAMKDGHGVPTPDTQERRNCVDGGDITVSNYNGLLLAFEEAAKGRSDKQIAIKLNSLGYRTTGTHGARPFSKDTVKDMLRNRFYLGELPDGNGGWIKAKHKPFISPELFEEAQRARAQRANRPQNIRSDAHIYSLSGIARCSECGSTLRAFRSRGRVRMVCNGRIKYGECTEPSTYLDVYEQQFLAYLRAFHIPNDYQQKILQTHEKLQLTYDVETQGSKLKARLGKIKELYEWGHKTKEEYLADYAAIQTELQQLIPVKDKGKELERLASFLKDITLAWEQASQEQRNKLASCLFEAVWIKDKKVFAVTPRLDFRPFFDLQYQGMSHYILHMRPRGDLNP